MSDVPRAPIDEFNARYCAICANRDCLRAGVLNRLSFDKRVQGWREQLFDAVPRASDGDPRFDSFRSKRFVVIQQADAPSVAGPSWAQPAREAAPEPPAMPDALQEAVDRADGPPDMPVAPPAAAPQPAVVPAVVPAAAPVNTPFVQGAFIGKPPVAQKDDGEISNGGTFTFGGSDE